MASASRNRLDHPAFGGWHCGKPREFLNDCRIHRLRGTGFHACASRPDSARSDTMPCRAHGFCPSGMRHDATSHGRGPAADLDWLERSSHGRDPSQFRPAGADAAHQPPSMLEMIRIVYRNPLELWGEPSYNEPWISVTGVGGPLVIANDPGADPPRPGRQCQELQAWRRCARRCCGRSCATGC